MKLWIHCISSVLSERMAKHTVSTNIPRSDVISEYSLTSSTPVINRRDIILPGCLGNSSISLTSMRRAFGICEYNVMKSRYTSNICYQGVRLLQRRERLYSHSVICWSRVQQISSGVGMRWIRVVTTQENKGVGRLVVGGRVSTG